MEAEIPWITARPSSLLAWFILYSKLQKFDSNRSNIIDQDRISKLIFLIFLFAKGKVSFHNQPFINKKQENKFTKKFWKSPKELSVVGGGVRFFSKGAGSCHAICNAKYSASFEIFARLTTTLEQPHLFRSSRLG